jgi:hypothetical protein
MNENLFSFKVTGNTDPLSVLNALKATDEYLDLTFDKIMAGNKESKDILLKWSSSHLKAKQALDHCGEFINHTEYWHLYKDQLDKAVYAVRVYSGDAPVSESIEESVIEKDKLKVAKVIASILGIDDIEKSNNPENLVNNALRKSKNLNKDSLKIVTKMLKLADEVGIKYDKKIIKTKESIEEAAAERASKYGRRYPNPIDNAWALSESKAPSIVVNKKRSDNMSALRPDDEKKLVAVNNLGKGEKTSGINPKDAKSIENYANTGHVSGISDGNGKNQPEYTHVGASLTTNGDDTLSRMKAKKLMNTNEDFTEEELEELVSMITEEDILETYNLEDFIIIDENGDEVIIEEGVNEEALNEVLSKMERIKAKLRMHKYESKLAAKRQIALKKHSDSHTINKRARHLAINLIKKKLLKDRNPSSLSSTEHERIDRIIEKKKKLIDRLALKLTSRVRQTEKERLSHK